MNKIYIYHFYNTTKIWLKTNNSLTEVEIKEQNISVFFYKYLEDILIKNKLSYSDINEFIFINGPGSFTSLRFFLTFAKALFVSYPEIVFIPLNLLEIIGFANEGTTNILMGGNREFLEFFHFASYKKEGNSFEIIEIPRIIKYEDAKLLKNPYFLGLSPDFNVINFEIKLEHIDNIAKWKKESNNIDNIVLLTPYYFKNFKINL